MKTITQEQLLSEWSKMADATVGREPDKVPKDAVSRRDLMHSLRKHGPKRYEIVKTMVSSGDAEELDLVLQDTLGRMRRHKFYRLKRKK